MPEGKITLRGLRDHLRRLWLAYLIGAVALLFLNNLMFTVTRTSFSGAETLRIMLLNTDVQIDEAGLLMQLQAEFPEIRAVECEPLASAGPEDANGTMLLMVKLTSGTGDVYITDGPGLALLEGREACGKLLRLENGLCLAVIKSTDNPGPAEAALPLLAKMIQER